MAEYLIRELSLHPISLQRLYRTCAVSIVVQQDNLLIEAINDSKLFRPSLVPLFRWG